MGEKQEIKAFLKSGKLKNDKYCLANGFPCFKCGLSYTSPICNRKRVK
jgi:hypothetical protein